jgi:uncharacterized FlaG/YvyC family protein
MDFSSAARPAPVSATNVTIRSDVVAPRDSVPVDLAPEKAVQSARAGEAVHVEIRERSREQRRQDAREQAIAEKPQTQNFERRIVIEPKTRSVVLQKSDPNTGEVVETIPDEAALRQRVYAHVLAEARARQAEADRRDYFQRLA